MRSAFRRQRLSLEFGLLLLSLPLLAWWQGELLRRWLIPQLLLLALLCLLLLRREPTFAWRQLWRLPARWQPCLLRIGLLLIAGGAALLAWAAWSGAADLFSLPRQRPGLWFAVLLLYPLLSALPQEVIFRLFFFQRYQTLFVTPGRMILASAGVFALAHLVLGNWQAPVLAWCGGLLFAWTYWRTRSLLLVTLEHGLWGNWLFTLGLGRYFYGGHI
ncbi:MAG: CPBP family intramembrane glutamic endopeptidase [Pseudomonadota bacterium]